MIWLMNGWALVVALAGAVSLGTLVGVVLAGLGAASKHGDLLATETAYRRLVARHHARGHTCAACVAEGRGDLARTGP
jgi:hypothetical protein